MRELKFRIWNGDNMVILDMVKNKYDFEDGYVLAFVIDAYREFAAHEFYPESKTEFDTMQFTGFKDEDGVDIYEDDILEWTLIFKSDFAGRDDTVSKTKYKVVHEMNNIMGIAGFYFKDEKGKYCHFHNFKGLKVIGNVHENQELFKPLNF